MLSVRSLRPATTRSTPVDGHGLRVAPVHRVEAKQIGEVLDVGEIVDRDELERRLVDGELQDRPSDSSQAVDGDSGAHSAPPLPCSAWMCAIVSSAKTECA